MALNPSSDLRDVRGIAENEKTLIKSFVQGAVYCWVKKGETNGSTYSFKKDW